MLTVLVAALCAFVALVLRNRPDMLILSYVAVWIIIPHTVAKAVMAVDFHPATLLVLFGLLTTLLVSSPAIRDAWGENFRTAWAVYFVLLAFLVLAALSQAFSGYVLRGFPIAIEQILAPLAAFAMARCALCAGQGLARRSMVLIVCLAAAEAALAIAQSVVQQSIPYETYFLREDWYKLYDLQRFSGTLDHPLVLGLLLSIAMWCLWIVPWVSVRLALATLYLAGIAATQSRTGLLLSVVGLIVIVAFAPLYSISAQPVAGKSTGNSVVRRLASVGAVTIAAFLAWRVLIGADVVQRLVSDDRGSAQARESAYDMFFANVHELLIWGGGSSSNYTFAQEHGSRVSFENPFMAYTADFGLLAAILYFGLQVAIAVSSFLREGGGDGGRGRFTAMTAMVAIIGTQAFSSLATRGASAMLLWLFLALASVHQIRLPSTIVGVPVQPKIPPLLKY